MTEVTFEHAPHETLDAVVRALGWIIDVDGCLVRTSTAGGTGGTAIPGAPELLRWLRERGRRVIVCTNASQRPAAQYASHLRRLGLDVRDDEMVTAATAAAMHIASRHPYAKTLAIGDHGLDEALDAQGVARAQPGGPLADVVVVGSADAYTTAAINAACLAIADNDAAFYVTVDFPWFHGGMGRSVSASTAIASAIASVTGRRAQTCGKPSEALARLLCERLGTSGDDIVVVGDVAPIEIKLAHMIGAWGVLVLSGATAPSDLAGLAPEHRPHVHVPDVGVLHRMIVSAWTTKRRHT